jgi:hypothetical protein
VTLTNSLTKPLAHQHMRSERHGEYLLIFKVVPATSFELARLAAGDFKSPTYPVQINDLGYFRKHEMTLNVSET